MAALVTAALVVGAFWVGGAVVSDDFRTAQAATAVLVGAVGVGAVLTAWRARSLAVPVLGAFAVSAAAAGGYLLWTSTVDRTVDEEVVVPVADSGGSEEPAGAVAVATGSFTAAAHPTEGTATLVRLADGSHVVTLTGFQTDPGPDLRVYLAPGDGSSVDGGVDLGALKGNKGDQQYDVPAGTPVDGERAVVVWCRAFTVSFGAAALA